MFQVISKSAKTLSEVTKEFEQSVKALLEANPTAVVGSAQAPVAYDGDEKFFYASAVIYTEARTKPQTESQQIEKLIEVRHDTLRELKDFQRTPKPRKPAAKKAVKRKGSK